MSHSYTRSTSSKARILFSYFTISALLLSPIVNPHVQRAYGAQGEVVLEENTDTSDIQTDIPNSSAENVQITDSAQDERGADEAMPTVSKVNGESVQADRASVVTGDSVSAATIENNVNENSVEIETENAESVISTSTVNPDTSGETETIQTDPASENHETASTTPIHDSLPNEESVPTMSTTSTTALTGVNASSTNEATLTNEVNATSETGQNLVDANGTIQSGTAVAYANVVNLVNTNIFNSAGLIAFFTQVLGVDAFDLRNAFATFTSDGNALTTPGCAMSVCGGTFNYSITNTNNATVTNTVSVDASSGGNAVAGNGSIHTGDAYAAANIVNVANTNITDSNYLLISFNNFGDYSGDIILPGGETLSQLFGGGGAVLSDTHSVTNENSANIQNNIETQANTGGNSGTGTITTGSGQSLSGVENVVNTNLFGGSDLLLVLRVHGDWSGQVFNLPSGIEWAETDGGIVLYNAKAGSATHSLPNSTSVSTANVANIQNNVSVYALTGNNKVGEGDVKTGNAYAGAQVTNVVNTNILGQNWALLIFDIFGNWNGNLAFGEPDLWVGGKVESSRSPIMPGDTVHVTYTVRNNGDAKASHVKLHSSFNPHELSLVDAGDAGDLGDVLPGETKTLSYDAKVSKELSRVERTISMKAEVTLSETDADYKNNTENITFYSGKARSEKEPGMFSYPAHIETKKTAFNDTVKEGGYADYTITLTNTGGALYKAVLRDIMKNPEGATSSEQYWDLGTIQNDETITVTYRVVFGTNIPLGDYTSAIDVIGLDTERTETRGKSYFSPVAHHTTHIVDDLPEVVTSLTPDSCEPLITHYLGNTESNDPDEVQKLQLFLSEELHVPITMNGIYDSTTQAAVKDFQKKYANEILKPWGMDDASGFVYYTTQKQINELNCDGKYSFPLTDKQLREISAFERALPFMEKNPQTSTVPVFGISSDDSYDVLARHSEVLESNASHSQDVTQTASLISSNATQTLKTITNRIIAHFGKMLHWFQHVALAREG